MGDEIACFTAVGALFEFQECYVFVKKGCVKGWVGFFLPALAGLLVIVFAKRRQKLILFDSVAGRALRSKRILRRICLFWVLSFHRIAIVTRERECSVESFATVSESSATAQFLMLSRWKVWLLSFDPLSQEDGSCTLQTVALRFVSWHVF